MKFETKFDLGETVYVIAQRQRQEWKECKGCLGTGSVTLHSGISYNCPECGGFKGHYDVTGYFWEVEEIGIINVIKCHRFSDSSKNDSDLYMFSTTGNGTFFPEEMLFRTHGEAEAVCKSRNDQILKETNNV